MPLRKLVDFYRTSYFPIYSDLVGYLGDKPRQVLVETENLLTHIICFIDEDLSSDKRDENLRKAYNHLVRVTIDCYKILWVAVRDDILEVEAIQEQLAQNGMSQSQFFAYKQRFKELSKEARRVEMENIGSTPEACIEAYGKVIEYGWSIIGEAKKRIINSQPSGEFEASSSSCSSGEMPPKTFISKNEKLSRPDDIDESLEEL